MIDDGITVSYHKTINATCKEKLLKDTFSGWELELPKPIEQIQVCKPFTGGSNGWGVRDGAVVGMFREF